MTLVVRLTSTVHSVNDTPLVSMVKDTNRPTVWSDGPQNKYDPVLGFMKLIMGGGRGVSGCGSPIDHTFCFVTDQQI